MSKHLLSGRPFDGVKETFQQKTNLIRSSIIGTIIGIIPGIGSATANFMAYIFAKRRSKHPETFGTGNPEGIVAAESANNSVIGGDLLPTLVFGIPGSVQMGVLQERLSCMVSPLVRCLSKNSPKLF